MQQSDIEARDRNVRVFVSSTFLDMQADRDHLAKFVFPQLRKLCEARDVTWGEVDLRWGITEEQVAEGKVLPICLAEIERSRPFFICLLGERYGWVPDEIDPALLQREPWLAETTGRSVTELEILHGVLNRPDMAAHAFFYLRDRAFVERVPAREKASLSEVPSAQEVEAFGSDEAARRAQSRARKLSALKERIRASGLPVRDGYRDPEALGKLVLEDFTATINRLFPAAEKLTPSQRARQTRNTFARSRTDLFVGREELLTRLDQHAAGDGPPLAILGDAGSGKSALLANWWKRSEARAASFPVFVHFVEADTVNTDWTIMLRRLMGELARHFALPPQLTGVEGDPRTAFIGVQRLRQIFSETLNEVARLGRVIILIDGVSQLEDVDGALDLSWLPERIPDGIRLVVSTRPGRAHSALLSLGWSTLEIPDLELPERTSLIADALRSGGRSLSPPLLRRLAEAPQTANPLYLRIILAELQLHGDHATLGAQLTRYLSSETLTDLHDEVLARYEADYDGDRPGLVRDAMSLLWSARHGLSEAEILDVLAEGGKPVQRARWSALLLAAGQSLANRSGRLSLGSDSLRAAVERRYAPSRSDLLATHLRLGHRFAERKDPEEHLPARKRFNRWLTRTVLLALFDIGSFFVVPFLKDGRQQGRRMRRLLREASLARVHERERESRKAAQLAAAEDWRGLYQTLSNLWFLRHEFGHEPGAVLRYWKLVEACSPLRATAAYEHVLRAPGDYGPSELDIVAAVLGGLGHIESALALREAELRDLRRHWGKKELLAALEELARLLMAAGEFDRAGKALTEIESLARELNRKDSLAKALRAQGELRASLGDAPGAEAMRHKSREVRHPAAAPSNEISPALVRAVAHSEQATALKAAGDLEGSFAQLQEAERFCRSAGDRSYLAQILGQQAMILYRRGDMAAAVERLHEEQGLCRDTGNGGGLALSLGTLGLLLRERQDWSGAMAAHKEEEEIYRRLGDETGAREALLRQAKVLAVRCGAGSWVSIDTLHHAASRRFRVLLSQESSDDALALLAEHADLCRRLGELKVLEANLMQTSNVLWKRREFEKLLEVSAERIRVCLRTNNRSELKDAHYMLGASHAMLKNESSAAEEFSQVELLCRELGDLEGLAGAMRQRAECLTNLGDLAGAAAALDEAERISPAPPGATG
jgi:tetratricopeptide (TPR) repeat protein